MPFASILRITLVLAAVALVACGPADAADGTRTTSACAAEAFFPADTQLFIGVRDLAGAATAFKKTRMYDVYAEPSVQNFLAQGVKRISFASTSETISLREAIGAMAFGVFNFEATESSPHVGLLLVVEIKGADEHVERIIDRMSRLFTSMLGAQPESTDGYEYLSSPDTGGPVM